MTDNVWALDLVEEVEVPGWLFIPSDLGPDERREWIAAAAGELIGESGWDGQPMGQAEVHETLLSALAERDATDSIAVFQVWPPLNGDAATCHIGVYPTAEMPDWLDSDAVVHRFEAPHIGSGIQCSTKRALPNDGGPDVELSGVHFIFRNETSTLVVSLAEAFEPLTVYALRGVLALLHSLRLVRPDTEEAFQSVAFEGVLEDGPWRFEESA
ncbi:hypothetical protein J2S40_004363 [Nocardioides luteus]|uniref:Uncharacterized protein n=1 Tax=Nocardioides luteus TaxID=1844 RepID=A0ABQ5SQE2_9ACTN|nr:hypothetical protein [Nocardioides luteus]MDR7313305.1 hypothetical protein [Nocardioides luteus]GGR60122.1 hypothetical protein GCM10010197_28680 [Nocardioides luteus]GLJ66370.1 hypothetical protein GCM10017579_04060 [Nocardioides luteus]